MEQGLCLPQEHARHPAVDRDGGVSEVTFRAFERTKDVARFCGIFWEYFWTVTGEDTSNWVDHIILEGVNVPMQDTEARLYGYLYGGCKIQLAEQDGEIVGFMLYHQIFDSIIAIRAMYHLKQRAGTGKGMIESLGKPIQRVIFQTQKERPPETLFALTRKHRRLISENEKLMTWEMDWRT